MKHSKAKGWICQDDNVSSLLASMKGTGRFDSRVQVLASIIVEESAGNKSIYRAV